MDKNQIKFIFATSDKKRDAKYVEKANENWNQLAKSEKRYNDIVELSKALQHFGLLEYNLKNTQEEIAFDA